MAWSGTILFSFVFWLRFSGSICGFPTDFLGNYVSDEEYNNRSLCWTPVCMKDSGRLIYDADHNSNKTAPCDDFRTFAVGEFFEHRVPNERYKSEGLEQDVERQQYERQKRILLKPIKQSEPKMFKVIKTYFRQCINLS